MEEGFLVFPVLIVSPNPTSKDSSKGHPTKVWEEQIGSSRIHIVECNYGGNNAAPQANYLKECLETEVENCIYSSCLKLILIPFISF